MPATSSPDTRPVPATTPRDLVMRRLAGRARRFPRIEPDQLDTTGLDQRDASLAVAIDQAVARRWRTLQTVLQTRLQRPWDKADPAVQAALLAGAAQIFLLDRVPDHAAINESVNWTKTRATHRASGMVNAVLRRMTELRGERVEAYTPGRADELALADGGAWRLTEPVFSEDPVEALVQQSSIAPTLIMHWIDAFGAERATTLALHTLMVPPIVLVADPGAVIADTPALRPHASGGAWLFDPAAAEMSLHDLLDSTPILRVQDTASARAVASTASRRPKVIADVCAGRGTKTRQLAATHPDARIIATDVDPQRLAVLRETFQGHPRVEVIAPETLRDHDGIVDLLVLDVPCTNTGVLARRVEARHRFNRDILGNLVTVQRQIVADTFPLLAPDGVILYSTCSVEAEENERQATWIAQTHGMTLVSAARQDPAGLPGDGLETYSDGAFFALLERAAADRAATA